MPTYRACPMAPFFIVSRMPLTYCMIRLSHRTWENKNMSDNTSPKYVSCLWSCHHPPPTPTGARMKWYSASEFALIYTPKTLGDFFRTRQCLRFADLAYQNKIWTSWSEKGIDMRGWRIFLPTLSVAELGSPIGCSLRHSFSDWKIKNDTRSIEYAQNYFFAVI